MFQSSKIAELQTEVARLEGLNQSSGQATAVLQAELDTVKAELATAQTAIAGHAETLVKLSAAEAKVTALEAEAAGYQAAKLAAEASVDAKVTERLAAAGVAPIEKAAKTGDDGKPDTSGLKGMAKAAALLAEKQPKK